MFDVIVEEEPEKVVGIRKAAEAVDIPGLRLWMQVLAKIALRPKVFGTYHLEGCVVARTWKLITAGRYQEGSVSLYSREHLQVEDAQMADTLSEVDVQECIREQVGCSR